MKWMAGTDEQTTQDMPNLGDMEEERDATRLACICSQPINGHPLL